jgi:hypothetical protein
VNLTRVLASAAVVLSVLLANPSVGFDIIVPDDQPTLADALSAADDGATIGVRAGTYPIGYLSLETWTKTISLAGADDERPVIVGGLAFFATNSCTLVFENLVFDGVQGLRSLAVSANAGGEVTASVHNCQFRGPGLAGAVAGGLVMSNATATVSHCLFVECSTNNAGAGLELVNTASLIDACVFDGNRGGPYGALTNYRCCGGTSVAEVRGCVFTANSSTLAGGGFYGYPGTAATIIDSSFCSNSPSQAAGAWTDGGGNVFSSSPGECLAADCDSNGISDADEIAAGAADLNANGVPDTCECIADLTGNGEVNGADISIILGFWGKVPEPLPSADINRDGLVDGLDLAVLLGSWGPCQ